MTSQPAHTSARRRFSPPESPSDRSRRFALVACITAIALFAVVGYLSYGPAYPAEPVDTWWNDLMLSQRTDVGLVLAWIPAVIGGPIAMLIIGLLLVGALLYLRWKLAALTIAVAMVVSVALAAPLAAVVAKTRPEGSLAESVPTSFPSGHTAMAATVTLILALLLRHWVAWALGVVWVLWMAWGRTYLQAHWLTDVVAGALLGIVAGLIAWYVIETIRQRRARAHSEA